MKRLALFALLVGCGGGGAIKSAGETCSASSECGDGLLCDFGQSPATCSSNGTAPAGDAPEVDIDAPATPIDGRPIDARPPDAFIPDAFVPDAPSIDAPAVDAV